MNLMETYESQVMDKVEAACQHIAPLWPLKNFVAVNPYFGLSNQAFWQAHETLERITGTGLCMPRAYYHEQIARGRITRADLAAALQQLGILWDVSSFEQVLARDTPASVTPLNLVTNVLGGLDGKDWSNFVVERISRYCAAYFDEGQALWSMPWRDTSLYSGWRAFTCFDKSPRMMGVRGMRHAMAALPDTAQGAIVWALRELDMPPAAIDDYLYAALLSIGGWAGWTRYLRWQAELQGDHDDSIRDLLAIRLAWDALLYKLCYSETLETHWRQSLAAVTKPIGHTDVGFHIDAVLQTTFEVGYQRQLTMSLIGAQGAAEHKGRADVQAVFCIDVRSEVYRRALETVAPRVQTLGFAGFFGILMEYLPFGAVEAKGHLPILFNPSYRIGECLDSANAWEADKLIVQRHTRMRVAKAWKTFKTSASSTFAFVEAVGLLSAPKLISDSMGWTRPVSLPERMGLSVGVHERLGPVLTHGELGSEACVNGGLTGIPETDRPSVAEFVLRNMGMVRDFARLVLFVGHGSTTVNNPQATGLDCGACGGQSGEVSARIAAALLNDSLTRRGLVAKGIEIPADTYFMAGLHDTTTDEVQLFNTDDVPSSHTADVTKMHRWLATAGQITRMERATFLGIGDVPMPTIHADMRRRTRDWAQVRPEWALAGNATFIAAPRSRTVHRDLAGRAFLHEYNWHNDAHFDTLQLIMTAPMIVANWINMQYYGSVVDNHRFGSGNKVLHNVVGGSIGVLEGNGGDLRAGLALQSLHDGARWMHEPMRLNVIIEAPQRAIDDVIARHNRVRELVDNAWIHLFQIDEDGNINRRGIDKQWRRN
ncbi:MAG: DUF2309 domain-containing protein [Firmicutes bacterium]|nr:DUF2309 domain-containing protein [Bacillota bacterium]